MLSIRKGLALWKLWSSTAIALCSIGATLVAESVSTIRTAKTVKQLDRSLGAYTKRLKRLITVGSALSQSRSPRGRQTECSAEAGSTSTAITGAETVPLLPDASLPPDPLDIASQERSLLEAQSMSSSLVDDDLWPLAQRQAANDNDRGRGLEP